MGQPVRDKIKLIFADSHSIVRSGLSCILGKDERFEILTTVKDGTELFSNSLVNNCDILVLDVWLPMMDALGVMGKIRETKTPASILIYTAYRNAETFSRMMGEGARGYILKSDPLEILTEALLNIRSGKLAISPQFNALQSRDELIEPRFDEILKTLTSRQREVLSYIAAGLTSRDIARMLGIKKSTVDKHRENIRKSASGYDYQKLLYYAYKIDLL